MELQLQRGAVPEHHQTTVVCDGEGVVIAMATDANTVCVSTSKGQFFSLCR